MKYEFNEYVWDKVWDCTAIVLRVDRKTPRPYIIAEISGKNKALQRVGTRREDDLSRYVHVKLPEDEAKALLGDKAVPPGLLAGDLRISAQIRITDSLIARGVL